MDNSIGISIDDSVDDYLSNPAFNNFLDPSNDGSKIIMARKFDDPLNFWKTQQKGGVLFKLIWALLFVPMFFWWDEITAIAFSMLR